MPTKRTPISRSRSTKISAEAVEIYRKLRAIHDGAAEETPDSAAMNDRLDHLLGRTAPWLCDLFSTIGRDGDLCPHPAGTGAGMDWSTALALRKALDKAIAHDETTAD